MELDGQRTALSAALQRVGTGDAAALKDVYNRTSAELFGVCLRILGEPAEAEDVLQEVYVAVWRSAAAFNADRASPITWLAAIARNRSIDRVRARHPERALDMDAAADIADATPLASSVLEASQEQRRLSACLGELDLQHQTAVRAAFLDGHTYEALAIAAGVPLGTMKSWIRRSLNRLRVCLER